MTAMPMPSGKSHDGNPSECCSLPGESESLLAAVRRYASRHRGACRSAEDRIQVINRLIEGAAETSADDHVIELLAGVDADARDYWISTAYTLLLPAADRKKQASYFTPPALVKRLLQDLEEHGVDFSRHRVLDPAAGGAAFLSSIAGRLAERGKTPKGLTGIEIDPALAWLANALLARRGGGSTQSVLCRDALETPLGTHDVVVMNPPYGRIFNPSNAFLDAYGDVVVPGMPNLYTVFMKLAVHAVVPGGMMAWVVPTSFIGGYALAPVRRFLLETCHILRIDMVAERKGVFVDVTQDICVVLLRRRRRRPASTPVDVEIPMRMVQAESGQVLGSGMITAVSHTPGAAWMLPWDRKDPGFRLADYGVTLKAGYLVWNRERHRILPAVTSPDPDPGEDLAHLIWACDVKPGSACRPGLGREMPTKVRFPAGSSSVLRRPAVILQRTTNSRQARRLVAAAIAPDVVRDGYCAENHTIVATPSDSKDVSFLAALLNSASVDRAYRRIAGGANISVKALRDLPLPDPNEMRRAFLIDGSEGLENALAKAYRI